VTLPSNKTPIPIATFKKEVKKKKRKIIGFKMALQSWKLFPTFKGSEFYR